MSTELRVEDMSCDGCEDIVETALEEVHGVESASADQETNIVTVDGNAETQDLIDAVDYAGYSAELAETEGIETESDETEDDE